MGRDGLGYVTPLSNHLHHRGALQAEGDQEHVHVDHVVFAVESEGEAKPVGASGRVDDFKLLPRPGHVAGRKRSITQLRHQPRCRFKPRVKLSHKVAKSNHCLPLLFLQRSALLAIIITRGGIHAPLGVPERSGRGFVAQLCEPLCTVVTATSKPLFSARETDSRGGRCPRALRIRGRQVRINPPSGRLREAAGAPGSPSVASVVPVSLPPSPAEEESYPLSPPEVISDVYGGAREAALNAIDFEEVRLRTRRPLPNPRPHAQHLVLGARIDNIERLINEKLTEADELSVGGVGLAC